MVIGVGIVLKLFFAGERMTCAEAFFLIPSHPLDMNPSV